MPSIKSIILTLALGALTTATLEPAASNTKGKCPASASCSGTINTKHQVIYWNKANIEILAAKKSTAIQAAECSHNTRTSGTSPQPLHSSAETSVLIRTETQTFAVFKTDHQYDSSHGAPYGTCEAYTCTAPTNSELTDEDEDCWVFFWKYVCPFYSYGVRSGANKSSSNGEDEGTGTGCIRSPDDGSCGCENSDGTFVAGSSSCF